MQFIRLMPLCYNFLLYSLHKIKTNFKSERKIALTPDLCWVPLLIRLWGTFSIEIHFTFTFSILILLCEIHQHLRISWRCPRMHHPMTSLISEVSCNPLYQDCHKLKLMTHPYTNFPHMDGRVDSSNLTIVFLSIFRFL